MKTRVAKKIVKNKENLNYTEDQVKRAEQQVKRTEKK